MDARPRSCCAGVHRRTISLDRSLPDEPKQPANKFGKPQARNGTLASRKYTTGQETVLYRPYTYTLRQSLEAGERVPSEFVAQEKLQVNEIDTAKLALVSAISLGLILLDESRFAELRRLNDLALALMGEVTETRRTGNIQPSRMAFQKQITVIAEFAKSDLSCSPY
jgi:hypothetical protein